MKSLQNPTAIDCDALAEREDLIKVFRKHKVRFAYLFGSQLTEYVNRESDVDIAVMLPISGTASKRFDIKLELMQDLESIFKNRVDIVVINDTKSLFFKYTIFREGKTIYSVDEEARVEFEAYTSGLYFDLAPFLDA